jgi:hypothetical protein
MMDQNEYKAKLDLLLKSPHQEISILVMQVMHIKELLDSGKITEKEFDDLYSDLTRIDNIIKNMDHYDLLVEVNAALTVLASIKNMLPFV